MRPADAAWLGLERPENRLVVTAVMRFTGVLEANDLRHRMQRVVALHPRLGQVTRRAPVRRAPSRWYPDPDLDLRHHVVDANPAQPCDDEALLRLASELVSQPLDPDRPPWQIHLVRRTGGGSAIVARFHHSLADGLALASVLLRLTDDDAPTHDAATHDAATHDDRAGDERAARSWVRRRVVTAARSGAAAVATVARLLVTPDEPATALRGRLTTTKALALTSPHDLEDVRATARAHDVSINDVLLAATAGGLRDQLAKRGGPVTDVRVLVPVDLRGGADVPADLGNLFGAVFVRLPVGQADPARRVRAVAARTARLKASAEAGATYLLLNLVGLLPRPVRREVVAVLIERTTSAVVTNVPGPRRSLTIGGCRVEDVAFWAPTVGRIGLGISLFSYAGTLTVGIAVDAALGLDATELAQAIQDELGVLRTSHRPPPRRSVRQKDRDTT
jgi:WS/DGAT/MGAT family acyltransferase